MNAVNSGMEQSFIPVRSQRQAMDWSLVLASQDIPTAIDRSPENEWALIVDAQDRGRALRAIRQYHLENRGWGWHQHLPWSDVTFHWGGLFWCLFLAFVYRVSMVEFPGLRAVGRFDSAAVASGEWWRLFTAVLLHADLAHLLANMTTGFLLFGLAMAQYGSGLGLLLAYLAGVGGNLAGLMIYPGPYYGLGASGMVMGALGLLSVQSVWSWRKDPRATRQWVRATLAGGMLFVLLGTDPSTDVVAHLGGFVSGALLGGLLLLGPDEWFKRKIVREGSWPVLIGLVILATWLALSHSK